MVTMKPELTIMRGAILVGEKAEYFLFSLGCGVVLHADLVE